MGLQRVSTPTIRFEIDPFKSKKYLKLGSTLFCSLEEENIQIEVFPGATTDGMSIPKILWPILGHPFKVKFLPAAVVHDCLYKADLLSCKTRDRVLLLMLQNYGVGPFVRKVIYYGVRAFEPFHTKYSRVEIDEARQYIRVCSLRN